MTLLALLLALPPAAPAPFPRETRPRPRGLAGVWDMHWGSTVYQGVVFTPQGGYGCCYAGRCYVGGWVLDRGVLTIHEWEVPLDPCQATRWSAYPITLDPHAPDLRGKVNDCLEVRFVPARRPATRSTGWRVLK